MHVFRFVLKVVKICLRRKKYIIFGKRTVAVGCVKLCSIKSYVANSNAGFCFTVLLHHWSRHEALHALLHNLTQSCSWVPICS